jgi:hypothetical protein
MTIMSGAVPEPHGEDRDPEIAVSAWTIGEAAEILALISELITAEPAVTAAIARFLDRKGADLLPAASWLTASISQLAAQLDDALAAEGISIDRGLARYWRPPAVAR